MGIADDVKYLEEKYNCAIEDCAELTRKEIEYKETIHRRDGKIAEMQGRITSNLTQIDTLYEKNDNLKLENAEIGDKNKDLAEKLSHAREANYTWMQKEIEYGETIRRLTIELNDKKKENASLVESKKNLESMLDLCESSCSECKKHIEVENLKNRIKNLESKLADRETRIEVQRLKLDTAQSNFKLSEERVSFWHDKYVSLARAHILKCPRLLPL